MTFMLLTDVFQVVVVCHVQLPRYSITLVV